MYTPNLVNYGPAQADSSRLVSTTRSETFLPATPPFSSSPTSQSLLPSTYPLSRSIEDDGLLDHHRYHPVHGSDPTSPPTAYHSYALVNQSHPRDHLDMSHDEDLLYEQTRSSSICISPRLLQDANDPNSHSFAAPYRNPFQASPTISTVFSSPRAPDEHPSGPPALHRTSISATSTQLPTTAESPPDQDLTLLQQDQEESAPATGGLVYSNDGNASAWWTPFEPVFSRSGSFSGSKNTALRQDTRNDAGRLAGESSQESAHLSTTLSNQREKARIRYSTRKRVENIKRGKRVQKSVATQHVEDDMDDPGAANDQEGDTNGTSVEMIQITSRPRLRKVDKTGELVWPFELETVLIAGLRKYHATACRPRPSASRNFNRNKLVSDYIEEVTGVKRSTKQIASRIQVLRDAWKGKKQFALVAQPKELSEMGYLPPIDDNYYAPPPQLFPPTFQVPPATNVLLDPPKQEQGSEGEVEVDEIASPIPTPRWSPIPFKTHEESPVPASNVAKPSAPSMKQVASSRASPYPRPKPKSISSRKKKKPTPGDSPYKGKMVPANANHPRDLCQGIVLRRDSMDSALLPPIKAEENGELTTQGEGNIASSSHIQSTFTSNPDVDMDLRVNEKDDHRRVFDGRCEQSPAHITASSDSPLVSLPNTSPTLALPAPNSSPMDSESSSSKGDTVVGHPSVTGANTGQSPISQNLVERAEASDKRSPLSSSQQTPPSSSALKPHNGSTPSPLSSTATPKVSRTVKISPTQVPTTTTPPHLPETNTCSGNLSNQGDIDVDAHGDTISDEDELDEIEDVSNDLLDANSLTSDPRPHLVSINPFSTENLTPVVVTGDSMALSPSWHGLVRMEDIVPGELAPHIRATVRKNSGISLTVLATCVLEVPITAPPLSEQTNEHSEGASSGERAVSVSRVLDQYTPSILLEIDSASIMNRIISLDEGLEKRARLGREIQVLRSSVLYDGKNRVVERQAGLVDRRMEKFTEGNDKGVKVDTTSDVYKFQIPLNNKMRELLIDGHMCGSIVENISIIRTSDSRLLESFVIIWVVEAKERIQQSSLDSPHSTSNKGNSDDSLASIRAPPLSFTVARLLHATERRHLSTRPFISFGGETGIYYGSRYTDLVNSSQPATSWNPSELVEARQAFREPSANEQYNDKTTVPDNDRSSSLAHSAGHPHFAFQANSLASQQFDAIHPYSYSSSSPPLITRDHQRPIQYIHCPAGDVGAINHSPQFADRTSSGQSFIDRDWSHQSISPTYSNSYGHYQGGHELTARYGDPGTQHPANPTQHNSVELSATENSKMKHVPVEWVQGYSYNYNTPASLASGNLERSHYVDPVGHPVMPSSNRLMVYGSVPHPFEGPTTAGHNSIVPSAHWQASPESIRPHLPRLEMNYQFPSYPTFSSHMGAATQEQRHLLQSSEMDVSPVSSQPVFTNWNVPVGESGTYDQTIVSGSYETYRRSSAVSTWSTGSMEYPSNTTSCSASSYAPSDKAEAYMASDSASPLPLPPSHLASQSYYHITHAHADYPVDHHMMQTSGEVSTTEDGGTSSISPGAEGMASSFRA